MYVCVCVLVWVLDWKLNELCKLQAAGNRFIYAAKIEFMQRKRFHFVSKQDFRFDLCAMPCHMPHIPAARMFHSLFSLTLPLSLSNCKRCWRLKYLIQQLHDGKTRPVYYCILYIHHALCVCVCVYVCACVHVSECCVCAVSWPVWLIKWRAKPTHLTPDRAKRGPFPQMSFCQAERNVRNKF